MAHILVIDDSLVVRELLGELLLAHGYEVSLAETADKGYELLRQKIPDLIFSDIDLPDVNGIELCAMLRRLPETRHVPIIMITGRVQDQAKAFQAGADDFVMKPFNVDELIERVRAVMRRSQRSAPPAAAPTTDTAPLAAPAAGVPTAAVSAVAAPNSDTAPLAAVPVAAPMKMPVDDRRQAVLRILFQPQGILIGEALPAITSAYLLMMVGVLNVSGLLAAGASFQPILTTISAGAVWGVSLSVFVVVCSISGLDLKWGEAARLMSCAGLPLLFKLLGGAVLAGATTLDSGLYTAGPALLMKYPPFILARMDVFELWSAALLWWLASRRGGSRVAAYIGTFAAWTAVVGALGMMAYFRHAS